VDERSERVRDETSAGRPGGIKDAGVIFGADIRTTPVNIRTRILIQTLSASIALTLALGTVFFISVGGIRKTVLANSDDLGDSAAGIGAKALEVQLTAKIDRIAQDIALILDERLLKIENHTRTVADITGSIYTTRQGWSPKPLPRVRVGDVPPPEPYLYIVPGVDYSRIRAEVELAGNISEMLRQITVVDRGIATSTIGGESGYVIAMDVNPWPSAEFDPRTFGWYRGATAANGLYWTDIYEDHRGRGPAVTCAVPFYEQSGGRRILRGVARSTVMLSDFSRVIDLAGLGRTGQLFILDRGGTKIYASDGAEITLDDNGNIKGEHFPESADPHIRSLGLSMTLGATGMTELEMDGLPVYVAYAPIQTLGWSLGVAVSAREVSASAMLIENQIWRVTEHTQAGIDRYILILAGIIAALLLLTLLGVAFFSVRFTHAITGPILALNDRVHEIAGGNLEREVVIKTGDELEQLAVSFNMMTAQLRRHIEEIARVTAERQRLNTELDIATQIQVGMLSQNFPPFPGRKNEFDLYAVMHPAREVGGDFYDFFFIDDDHFALVIADVSGKGIPAALFMATAKTIIKNRLQSGEDPVLTLEIVNRQLCDNNISYMFVTVWLCVLEITSGRLVYVNAGHNPPLLKQGADGFSFLVSPPDLPLASMDDTRYHCRELTLNHGDTLFLYTDGIVEAADTAGGFYGKERFNAFLDTNAAMPLREMLPRLRADIAAFCGGAEQSDDITMLAIRICGGAPPRKTVTLKADIACLDELNAFIGRELDSGGCPEPVRGQIELAVEEVFVNIAHYAYQNTGGTVTVDCRTEPVRENMTMTVAFRDKGRAFNPLEYPPPDITLPLEERQPGGLGLLIVRKTMDTIQYRRENETNCLEFGKSWRKEG
jgi:sigma-B regulation protein RsbU (phosphoserine phosphatase)